jgi:hypothetical protein
MSYKSHLLTLLLLLIAYASFGQYSGGSGDGYAASTTTLLLPGGPLECDKDSYEPNDIQTAAANLYGGVLAGINAMKICPPGDVDWFTFSLNNTRNVQLRLENLPADYNLELHDGSGLLASSANSGSANELIQLSGLMPGAYFVRVAGANDLEWSFMQAYNLILTTSFPAPSGSVGTKPDPVSSIFRADPAEGLALQLFPNPASGFVTVLFRSETGSNAVFELMDLTGRRLKDWNVSAAEGENQLQLELPVLTDGVYLLKVQAGGLQKVVRLVVRR